MPSYAAAGLGQGLAQGAGQFAQALARVGQMRRQRKLDRRERERYHDKIERDETWRRLQLARDPNISIGERPEEGPMTRAVRKIGALGEDPVYQREAMDTYTVPGLGTKMPATPSGFERGVELRRQFYPDQFRPDAGPQMPWEEQGFPNKESYLDWLRERGAAMRKPESERRKTPTYGQAKTSVDEMFRTGSTYDAEAGEMQPAFSLPAPARAAKADSVAAGDLPLSELAGRFEGERYAGADADRSGGRPATNPAPAADETPPPQTAGAGGDEPATWDGPATFDHWVRTVEFIRQKTGTNEKTIRSRLKNQGLTDGQVDRIFEAAGD